MNKFVLLDHALKDLGGHYYTYASCVLPAAERAGLRCVLAINHEFRDFAALPAHWETHAVFRHRGHTPHRVETRAAGPLSAWLQRIRHSWRTKSHSQLAEGFAEDCARLFATVPLSAGDHVFLATASEIDLLGLASFLGNHGNVPGVHWHLQFHVGFLHGRPSDYAAQQAAVDSMRALFTEAAARSGPAQMHFYCTTEQLTAQYQLLDAGVFRTLPYPVHPLFRNEAVPRESGRPLRIACLGHSRREKGYRQLPAVVRSLWEEYLRPGRAQLLLQTRRRDLRRPLDTVVAQLGAHSDIPPVSYAQFPLTLERYASLVRSADVGLLLYDADRYYARCSGVLLEMLSCGVPVVVPAGGWLSEQIAEENQRYLDDVAASEAVRVADTAFAWALPVEGMRATSRMDQTFSFARTSAAVCEFAVQPPTTGVLLSFGWSDPQAGTYVRITLDQLNSMGSLVATSSVVVGPRSGERPTRVLLPMDKSASVARLTWRNAWGDTGICLHDFACLGLTGPVRPAGIVGLAAAAPADSIAALHEILSHFDHYQQGAASFARRCSAHHNADRTVTLLLAAAAHTQCTRAAGDFSVLQAADRS